MASKAVSEERNARTCSICIDSFKQPKLLPCFHSFCVGCLEQYTSKKALDGRFPCPVCRHEVTLPQTGVKGFQTNFYIEAQVFKDEHAEAMCEVCSQTALNRCRECEQLLCEHCTNVHSSLKMTRSHILIRLGETSREYPVLSKPEFCPKHKGELFRFHCQDCERAICRDCKLTSHERHPTVDLEDVIKEGHEQLSKVKVEFEELLEMYDRKLQENSANKEKFVKSVLDIEMGINAMADTMISQINDARMTKLREVTALKKSELDHLVTMETCFNEEKKFLEGHISHVTTLLKEGCGADVLNTLPDMKRRLEEFKSETKPAQLKNNTHLLPPQNRTIQDIARLTIFGPDSEKSDSTCNLLKMLKFSPFSYGRIIDQVYDSPHTMDITDDDLRQMSMQVVRNIASLSLMIGFPTAASAPHSIVNGFKNLLAIAVETDYTFAEAEHTKEYLENRSKFASKA